MNFAILLSGGVGQRINSEIPKQYVKASGHMMISYSLSTLLSSRNIDRVVVVSDPSYKDAIIDDVSGVSENTKKLSGWASSGENRQLSILQGLRVISGIIEQEGILFKKHTVLVHDAARPFLNCELLDDMYSLLPGYDGVMPVLPMKDTVYISNDGESISDLIDRKTVFAGQAPELFDFHKYLQSNEKLMPDGILEVNGASEVAVKGGMNIRLIPGDENNIKITTDNDMDFFRAYCNKLH